MAVRFIDVISVASSTPRHERGSNFKKKHHRKIKIINNTDPTKNLKWTHVLEKGKKLLFLIRNLQGKITKHLYFAKLWIQINTKQVRSYIVITIGYSVVYMGMWTLSVTCCMSAVVCRGVYSMCYLRQHGGYLSVTWGRLAVICQLHQAGWLLSVSYMRQVGGCLSVTWGRLAVVCTSVCVLFQKIEAGWWLSVSYTRQDDGYLSVTWGKMKDICQLDEAALSLYVS